MTFGKLKAARNNAERRVNDWWDKREAEVAWLCTPIRGNMTPLTDVFRKEYWNGDSIANAVQNSKCRIYEEDFDDDDDRYKECTRRAISRLRRIEQKLKEWNDKYCCLDFAVEEWDDEIGLSDITRRELAALGYKF